MLSFAPAGRTQTELETGRRIYVGICSKCHTLDSPSAYSNEKWERIVADMAEPAKISTKQQAILLTYLLSARAQMESGKSSR